MLTVTALHKEFTGPAGKTVAVRDVGFELPLGSFASIVGPSGSGKSTLLAMLGALEAPTSGTIRLGDTDITTLTAREQTAFRRDHLGFVFQRYHLIRHLTALENVMLPMELTRATRKQRLDRAEELLQVVGIDPVRAARRPALLSGGEQQRVAIARSLANAPALVLADEPTGSLDAKTSKRIVALLRGLTRAQNVTVLVVTHDPNVAAQTDHRLTIRDGRLAENRTHPHPH